MRPQYYRTAVAGVAAFALRKEPGRKNTSDLSAACHSDAIHAHISFRPVAVAIRPTVRRTAKTAELLVISDNTLKRLSGTSDILKGQSVAARTQARSGPDTQPIPDKASSMMALESF